MSYIIFLQPAILSGAISGNPTGMDFGAVMTATCLSAAASLIIGLWARYPIGLAPGMGENFFVITVISAATKLNAVQNNETEAWKVALGFIFYPVLKIFSGKVKKVRSLMYAIAVLMLLYYLFIR